MNELETIKRAIKLKQQGLDLINDEIIDLQIRLSLVVLRNRLEEQIDKDNNPATSRKLDCVVYLLEN